MNEACSSKTELVSPCSDTISAALLPSTKNVVLLKTNSRTSGSFVSFHVEFNNMATAWGDALGAIRFVAAANEVQPFLVTAERASRPHTASACNKTLRPWPDKKESVSPVSYGQSRRQNVVIGKAPHLVPEPRG
jgi:hypothetical protein|tara:strand:- start:1459 stop:1860 length:402 start_codon:yes stop_codon:yes gene_type:complete